MIFRTSDGTLGNHIMFYVTVTRRNIISQLPLRQRATSQLLAKNMLHSLVVVHIICMHIWKFSYYVHCVCVWKTMPSGQMLNISWWWQREIKMPLAPYFKTISERMPCTHVRLHGDGATVSLGTSKVVGMRMECAQTQSVSRYRWQPWAWVRSRTLTYRWYLCYYVWN